MKGFAVTFLLVFAMLFGSVKLSSSQCGQVYVAAGDVIISSIGELGGVDLVSREIIIDEETYTLSPSIVFCSELGVPLAKTALISGSTVSYDYTENREVISLTVEVVPDETAEEIFVRQATSGTGGVESLNNGNSGRQGQRPARQALYFEDGVWKN
jgi:hypothetical protein